VSITQFNENFAESLRSETKRKLIGRKRIERLNKNFASALTIGGQTGNGKENISPPEGTWTFNSQPFNKFVLFFSN
jgi:hypothetical protein